MKLGELAGPVEKLHLLADKVMIEMLQRLFSRAGRDVQPDRLDAGLGADRKDKTMRNDLGLGVAEECFAATVRGKAGNVVRAQAMEEEPRVGAAQLDFAVVRLIEQRYHFATAAIFLRRRSETRRDEPTGLLDKRGAGIRSDFMERRAFGHDRGHTSICGGHCHHLMRIGEKKA